MYGLFEKLRSQPGQRDALIKQMLEAAKVMAAIDGCFLYVIHSAPDDPEGVWVYEVWRSHAHHDASLAHDAVKAVMAAALPLIAETGERIEVTPIGGKGLGAG